MAQRMRKNKKAICHTGIFSLTRIYHQKVLHIPLKQNSGTGTNTPNERLLRCHKLTHYKVPNFSVIFKELVRSKLFTQDDTLLCETRGGYRAFFVFCGRVSNPLTGVLSYLLRCDCIFAMV